MNKIKQKIKIKSGSELGVSTQEFNVTVSTKQVHNFSIFLQDSISSAEDFQGAIQVFNMANEDDEVTIYLSTPGGSMDAGQTFISEMMTCKARVIIKASGQVASMGALILLASEEFQLDPFTNILFHGPTYGDYGAVSDVVQYSAFVKKQTERMFRYHCAGFFSPEEVHNILENKFQHWMDSEEFCVRYKNKMRLLDLLDDYLEEQGIEPAQFRPYDLYETLEKVKLWDEARADEDLTDVPLPDLEEELTRLNLELETLEND